LSWFFLLVSVGTEQTFYAEASSFVWNAFIVACCWQALRGKTNELVG